MKMRQLGRTDIQVSEICLGSMTWGSQNSTAEGMEQIDYALAHGVNFIDTAEMYPTTPLSEETLGATEKIIGEWLSKSGKRDEIVLASKITGNGRAWIYGGQDITAEKIRLSVEDSLKRLQTDRIDLYQLHWPNRGSYHFRNNWGYDPSKQDKQKVRDSIHEVLHELDAQVRAGKLLHIGLSNESAWGTAQFLSIAEKENLPRVASVQNEYSLMCRLYDLDMAELSHQEDVGLLAFSPLAAGMLTGKYADSAMPAGSRRTINDTLGGRVSESSLAVSERYSALAREHGLDPSQMALAFCLSRPFMASTIIGATTMEQLKTDIEAASITLSEDVQAGIREIYRMHPVPM